MSIATEIQRLQQAKADIKAAIENKGVTVGDGTIDTFASKISEITGGGGSAEGCVTVTFMNGANVLLTRPVYIGDDCPDPLTQGRIETPTKESTVQYNYTYSGWASYNGGTANSNVLKNITEDTVIYASFAESIRQYTITYYDEDGVTVLHTEQLGYGTIPSYTPTKDDAVFVEWFPSVVAVTGNISYTASWKTGIVALGSCGDSATWELTVTGELIIRGTGAMYDYVSSWGSWDAPYASYGNDVTSVTVEDGISHISEYAFYNCVNIVSVSIPDSVESIGQMAFYYNKSLTSIIIPDNVTSIGKGAFWGCSTFTSIIIPVSVTSIGQNTFYICNNLNSVTFEDTEGWSADTTALGSNALANPSTAAVYLTSTYRSCIWTKS